jgi:hypothetical protein
MKENLKNMKEFFFGGGISYKLHNLEVECLLYILDGFRVVGWTV